MIVKPPSWDVSEAYIDPDFRWVLQMRAAIPLFAFDRGKNYGVGPDPSSESGYVFWDESQVQESWGAAHKVNNVTSGVF